MIYTRFGYKMCKSCWFTHCVLKYKVIKKSLCIANFQTFRCTPNCILEDCVQELPKNYLCYATRLAQSFIHNCNLVYAIFKPYGPCCVRWQSTSTISRWTFCHFRIYSLQIYIFLLCLYWRPSRSGWLASVPVSWKLPHCIVMWQLGIAKMCLELFVIQHIVSILHHTETDVPLGIFSLETVNMTTVSFCLATLAQNGYLVADCHGQGNTNDICCTQF